MGHLPKKVSEQELKVYEYICFQNPIVTIEDGSFVFWFYNYHYNPEALKTLHGAKRRCSTILSILYKRGYLDRTKIKTFMSWRYAYHLKNLEDE